MIGQYLSNKNQIATVPKIQKFCQLNKALCHLKWTNYKIMVANVEGGNNQYHMKVN
jgi:hypothetical protein